MNETENEMLSKIMHQLHFLTQAYTTLHNQIISGTTFRLDDTKFREAYRDFKYLIDDVKKDLKEESIIGTMQFIAKKLHKIEDEIREIKKSNTKKIDLSFRVDGYEYAKVEKTDRSNVDPIKRLLQSLTEREAYALKHRYGLDRCTAKTYDELGILMGVTRERSRQIVARAERKCRHPSRSSYVKEIPFPELRKAILGDKVE